ncbi:FHA domain-containing protein [Mucilaginibacter sp.]|uniref:FHA domain-containing protein n=1 Tax=Mucilaginibacter sp. TaxID=1882438 RepID=UPI00261DA618|nr:FHA domain-containing protein [Mucilaginibacter sp.]MDB5031784.1 hypothetical protein [Mucilaginibacter sp.]
MFNLFSKGNSRPNDVKSLRNTFLQAVKEQLQKAEGGEGRNIKGINFYILENVTDKHIYEAAVYLDEQDKFKQEIQRIADDFALDLPANWTLDLTFKSEFPPEAIRLNGLYAAIFIQTKDHTIQKQGEGYIRVLAGEAEKEEYHITSKDGVINIGREKRVQVDEGFFRHNHLAFPGDSDKEPNKYISRQHAHIEWNNEKGCFMIFADEGGIPPGNKIKIRSINNENLIKLNSMHIGHQLADGDQIILGESAVVEFSYS